MHAKRAQAPLFPNALMFLKTDRNGLRHGPRPASRRPRACKATPHIAVVHKRSVAMRSRRLQLILILLTAISAGCTTMGTGVGSTTSGGSRTTFSWKSSDGVSGTMTATVSSGQTYSGQYFQITKDTTVDSLGPLWYPGWGGRGGSGRPSRLGRLGLLGCRPVPRLHYALHRPRGRQSCGAQRHAHAMPISARASFRRNERGRRGSVSIAGWDDN